MKSSLIILPALLLLLSSPMYSQTAADTIFIKKNYAFGTFSYQQNGKWLNNTQVAQVLKSNSLAYNDFIRAQNMNRIAKGLGLIGIFVMGIGGYGSTSLFLFPYQPTSLILGAIGITFMAISIPLIISAKKKFELAIVRYNQGLLKNLN